MKSIFTFIFFLTPLLFCGVAFAATEPYIPMVGVPGLEQANNYTAEMYIDALYKLAITVGGILAVIQIIFGGVMYMFDGSITRKEDGKDKIKGALFGLLIILGAVLLLQTINPDLLNLKIFNNAPSIAQINNPAGSTPKQAQIGDTANPADAKDLIATCSKAGGVVENYVAAGSGGRGTLTKCFTSANSINAKAGDTFNASLYAPSKQEDALDKFVSSCGTNGGSYSDNFGPDTCEKPSNAESFDLGPAL